MKKFLIVPFLILIGYCGFSQAVPYNPLRGQPLAKPIAPSTPIPLDFRSYYFDSTHNVSRPYLSTAEVKQRMNNALYRVGHYPIIINNGGSLGGDWKVTGGINEEWWFKDGVADSNLVKKYYYTPADTARWNGGFNKRIVGFDYDSLSGDLTLGLADGTVFTQTLNITGGGIAGANNYPLSVNYDPATHQISIARNGKTPITTYIPTGSTDTIKGLPVDISNYRQGYVLSLDSVNRKFVFAPAGSGGGGGSDGNNYSTGNTFASDTLTTARNGLPTIKVKIPLTDSVNNKLRSVYRVGNNVFGRYNTGDVLLLTDSIGYVPPGDNSKVLDGTGVAVFPSTLPLVSNITVLNDSTLQRTINGVTTNIAVNGRARYLPPGDNTKVLDGTGAAKNPLTLPLVSSLTIINDTTAAVTINGVTTNYTFRGAPTKVGVQRGTGLNVASDSSLVFQKDSTGLYSGIRLSNDTLFGTRLGVEGVIGKIVTTAKVDQWYEITEASPTIINLNNGSKQKLTLTATRAVSFTNLHHGSVLELWLTHATAGAELTGLGVLPWDYSFATGTNERTKIVGTYDSIAATFNFTLTIFPPLASGTLESMHLMAAYLKLTPSVTNVINGDKALGYKHSWVHVDDYTDSLAGNGYRATVKRYADTMAILGGMTFTPGLSGAMSQKEHVQMAYDFINHPAIYKFNGKPVIAIYNFDSTKLVRLVDSLTNRGVARSSYLIMASTSAYPQYQYWLPTPAWVNNVGLIEDSASAAQVYNFNPQLDGLMNFSGDKATSIDSLAKNRNIAENTYITKASAARGKISYAGYTVMYHNDAVQNWTIGLRGADSVLRAIVAAPVKPTFVGVTTANDQNELSNATFPFTPVTNGLFYQPTLESHFYVATGAYPSLDKSGISELFKPHFLALSQGKSTITTPAVDIIVTRYGLHPRNATPSNVIPSALVPYRYADSSMITQAKWNVSRAAVAPTWPAAGKMPLYDYIEMAVWLVDSANLVINGNISATKYGPGFASYSIAMPTSGLPITPTFAIRRGGTNVITVSGAQAITTSTWPGQYDQLIQKLYFFNLPGKNGVQEYGATDDVNEYINSLQLN